MNTIQDIGQFEFDNNVVLTRDANNKVTQIVQTGKLGNMKKTINITRDSNGNVTSITTTT